MDAGYRMQDTGYKMMDTGYWILDKRYWMVDIEIVRWAVDKVEKYYSAS